MASPNDIKKGMVINQSGELWVVVDFQRVSPGKGGSFVRTKMKSVKSGKVVEHNLKASENVTFENVQNKKMQYLFADGAMYTFMDNVSYEQVSMAVSDVGDDSRFLKEGLVVTLAMHEGVAIAMQLPLKIEYEIAYTEPAVKGDTVSGNLLKEAEADNGMTIKVPAFIKQGDRVMVNTDSGEYTERIS